MIGQLLFFVVVVGVIAFARVLERRWPIVDTPHDEVVDDWKAVGVSLILPALFSPLVAVSSSAMVNWAGGGLIHLRTDGYWYFISLIILVVLGDLYRYFFHRIQHAVPFLWAMHSFHHSANALTMATGARHLWIERVLSQAFLPVFPMLFSIPPDMSLAITLILFLPDSCAHLNVRFSLGRMVTWLNSPQWHRIHHSVQPEHWDKNFAAVFPLWDIVFGTAVIPKPNDYPATGLVPAERVDVIDSIVWPIRHLLRRRPHAA